MLIATLTLALIAGPDHPFGVDSAKAAVARLRAILPDGSVVRFHGTLLGDNRILATRHALAGAARVEYAVTHGWRSCAVIRHDPRCDIALIATRVRADRLSLASWTAAPSDPVLVGGAGPVPARPCRALGARRERAAGLDAKLLELDMLSVRDDSGLPVLNVDAELVGLVGLSEDHNTTKAIDITEIRYFLEVR